MHYDLASPVGMLRVLLTGPQVSMFTLARGEHHDTLVSSGTGRRQYISSTQNYNQIV